MNQIGFPFNSFEELVEQYEAVCKELQQTRTALMVVRQEAAEQLQHRKLADLESSRSREIVKFLLKELIFVLGEVPDDH